MDVQTFNFREKYGYLKIRFRDIPFGKKPEISLFFWEDGQSPPHNHKNTREFTYVAVGTLKETRKVDGQYIDAFYHEGDLFEVPQGTEHVVIAVGVAITLNFCEEELDMDILENFGKDAV